MKLLFVTPYYPPLTYGGIESHVTTLSRSMARRHHCTVAAPSTAHDTTATEQGIRVYRTEMLRLGPPTALNLQLLNTFFEVICDSEGIDRIIAHNLHMWLQPEVAESLHSVAARRDIPVFLRVHNYCDEADLQRVKRLPWAKILCISKKTAAQLLARGVERDRVVVLYPPIDTSLFHPQPSKGLRRLLKIPDDAVVVLHASRLVGGVDTLADKGVPALLDVISRVKDAMLVISYPPPAQWLKEACSRTLGRIRELALALSIGNRVHIVSATHSHMPGMYQSAQIFVMLSQIEALGSVYLEAAACGVPVIGADVGGVSEAIQNDVNGFVVPDAEAAVDKIQMLVRDAGLRHRMGVSGSTWVQQTFRPDVVADRLTQLLS